MEQDVAKLHDLIKLSERILITSHISPDADALSSLLLFGTTLRLNFPDKHTSMVLEEEPLGLDFLHGYTEVEFGPIVKALEKHKSQLFVLLDGNNYERCSRLDGAEVRKYIAQNDVKTVIIDHHEPTGKDKAEIYINQASPATVQDVYEVLFNGLSLKNPAGYAQTTMLGLYSDSNGFSYHNPRHSATFKLADELISAGADIEEIDNLTHQYTDDDIRVFAELAANTTHQDDYTYSFVKDEFVSAWVDASKNGSELHRGTEAYVNSFLRSIGGRKWGFIVCKNLLQGENIYSASFRSAGDTKDVSAIAAKLGGGGHKPAAGARFESESVEEAIDNVKDAIASA